MKTMMLIEEDAPREIGNDCWKEKRWKDFLVGLHLCGTCAQMRVSHTKMEPNKKNFKDMIELDRD